MDTKDSDCIEINSGSDCIEIKTIHQLILDSVGDGIYGIDSDGILASQISLRQKFLAGKKKT